MQRAFAEALTVRGHTLPNPAVGAAILDREGNLVATGATQPPGGEHAEAMALRRAGERAKDGLLAVTLEPCVDFPGKRTPACSLRIATSGLARVLVGSLDPDPRVFGKGVELLRTAGLDVEQDPMDGEIPDFYAGFARFRHSGCPRTTLKIAMSADGMAAAAPGLRTAITGPEAKRFVHRLRSRSDAILIGKGTLLADDPALTVREVAGNSPQRLVLWSGPFPSRDFQVLHGGKTSFCGCGRRPQGIPAPCEWIELPPRPSLHRLLEELGTRGIHDLLVEPGPGLLASFLQESAWDRLWVLRSPDTLPGGHSFAAGTLPRDGVVDRVRLGRDEAMLYAAAPSTKEGSPPSPN